MNNERLVIKKQKMFQRIPPHNNANLQVINGEIEFVYLPQFFGIFLAFLYLAILPKGLFGLLLTLLSFGLTCIGVNKKTFGVYCLFLGSPVFGAVFQCFGINYIGTMLSMLLGFILLFKFKSSASTLKGNWFPPVWWLIVIVSLLIVFYILGPKTEYCKNKLFGFIVNLVLAIIALSFIVGNPTVNIWHLGTLGIISAVVYYSTFLYSFPGITPSSIWITGGIRIGSKLNDTIVATETAARIGSTGIIFLLSSIVDKILPKRFFVLTVVALAVGYILLNSVGERLFLMIPPLATASLILCRPMNKKYFRIISCLLLSVIVLVIWLGMKSENKFITSAFGGNRAFSERANRDINWDAAVTRIKEKPLLGHGLGGYYVNGYSYPGSGTYAHNLILELLSETGVIGTVIILLPFLVFFYMRYRKRILLFRTANGGSLIPLLVMNFLHAMISNDLRQSCALFAVTAVLWAYVPISQRHVDVIDPC